MRWFILLLLFIGCARLPEPLQTESFEELHPNTYIDELTQGRILGDVIIRGVVTTSDSCGNFYQSMILQDPTSVIELRFAFYDIYSLFRRDELVSVKLFNRDITYENGILCVNMGSLTLVSQTVFRQGLTASVPPTEVRISAIDSTMVGRLVELRGGEFVNGGMEQWSGEQRYRVGKESIVIYTTPFASYANDYLPYGEVVVRGIVTLFKGKFQLKISSPSDVIRMDL